MSILTETDKARLKGFKNINPLESSAYSEEQLTYYRVLLNAPVKQVVEHMNTPAEWLAIIFDEAKVFGPQFREVKKLLMRMKRLGRGNFFISDVHRKKYQYDNDFRNSMEKARVALQLSGYAYNFSEDETFKAAAKKNTEGSWRIYIQGVLVALMARDLIGREWDIPSTGLKESFTWNDYETLTIKWRERIGVIHSSDLRPRRNMEDEFGFYTLGIRSYF